MRKLFLSILLASAAVTPALADPPTREEREQARQERQQARDNRQQSRSDRAQPQVQVRPQMQVQPQVQLRPQTVQPTARMQTIRPSNNVNVRTARDRAEARQDRVEARDQRIDQRQQLRQDRIEARQIRQASRAPVVSTTPRPGTQPPLRVDSRRSSAPQWSTNWRHNSKYDWNGWRHKHRSLFHLGFYFDPFGWGYQPYSIGWRLWPSYYSSRYWINDPYQYRLPYAPPGYQWVRYWNDAILVDTWTGEVVDVLYNFFW